DYDAVVTEPTCTEGGYTTYTCTVCGDTYVGDKVTALGHDYDAVVTEPTCTEGGYTTYTCTVCGDTYVGDEVTALGHDYEAIVTEPDCLNGGYTTYVCTVCGDTYVDDEVSAHGHNYEAVVTPPTCTEGGYTTYTCSECGDSFVANELPAAGHKYDNGVVTAPTCTEGGYTTYTCTECGDSYVTSRTPAASHSYDNGVVTAPTCTKEGYTTYTCTVCGDTYVTSKTPVIAHTYTETSRVEPTCTEKGKVTYTCACGDTYDEALKATGHTDTTFCENCGEFLCDFADNCPSKQFTDLDTSAWYHEATDFVIHTGLMNGIGGGKFDPAGTATRAMIITTLYRLEGSPAVSGKSEFTDVEAGSWYEKAVIWATKEGVTNGIGGGKFAPTDVITREQLVVMMNRYLKYKGVDVSETTELSKFVDADKISSWALVEMKWAVSVEFVKGRTESLLAPGASVQRSELATLLFRLCKNFLG
ncbi:MAG: S-layer homology domain-containing protein, partial [Clostridia bacterium]|nr:S-layer homology domain-containing protein [Clostridia bacterium]